VVCLAWGVVGLFPQHRSSGDDLPSSTTSTVKTDIPSSGAAICELACCLVERLIGEGKNKAGDHPFGVPLVCSGRLAPAIFSGARHAETRGRFRRNALRRIPFHTKLSHAARCLALNFPPPPKVHAALFASTFKATLKRAVERFDLELRKPRGVLPVPAILVRSRYAIDPDHFELLPQLDRTTKRHARPHIIQTTVGGKL